MSTQVPGKQFFVRFQDGTVVGPLDKQAVRAMAEAGRLAPDDLLSSERSGKWVAAKRVAGLADVLGSKADIETIAKQTRLRKSPRRWLVLSGTAIAVLVVAATIFWFVRMQRDLELRARAMSDVREVVETAESLPPSASPTESIRVIERARSLAEANRGLLDQSLIARTERLTAKLTVVRAIQQFENDAAALANEIDGAEVSKTETVPATGLFATDPAKAERELTKLYDQHAILAEAVRRGESVTGKEIRQYLTGMVNMNRITLYEWRYEFPELLEALGHPSVERQLSEQELKDEVDRRHRQFVERASTLSGTARSPELSGYDATSSLRRVEAAIQNWMKRHNDIVEQTPVPGETSPPVRR